MEERKNMVIIDDEDDFLILRDALQTLAPGITLSWFDSPEAFLESACWHHHLIHLLILDLDLGAETSQHWQQEFVNHECCQGVPIVVYSGSEAPGDRQKMIELGAADFIEKASTTAQMQNVVARMMAQLV